MKNLEIVVSLWSFAFIRMNKPSIRRCSKNVNDGCVHNVANTVLNEVLEHPGHPIETFLAPHLPELELKMFLEISMGYFGNIPNRKLSLGI